jgi:hypothetical protein
LKPLTTIVVRRHCECDHVILEQTMSRE